MRASAGPLHQQDPGLGVSGWVMTGPNIHHLDPGSGQSGHHCRVSTEQTDPYPPALPPSLEPAAPLSDLVLLSGGLDSATLLAKRVTTTGLALSVDYGQRHAKEIAAAAKIAAHYGVPHRVLDLSGWGGLLTGSSLTDPAVGMPYGHYADESMRVTVVPNRNATLLMAAAGIAASRGLPRVLTAVHAGDHPIYPDCRPEFITAAAQAAELGTGGAVTVLAPFVHVTKTEIARLAGRLGVPIGLTWSCYEGRQRHCGRCGTCWERQEALRDAGVPDPTEYEG